MMTTLAMYAVSAALYAAAPTDQGSAQTGGSGSDPAAESSDIGLSDQGATGGVTDPSQARVQGRRPQPRNDSATQPGLSSDRGEMAPPTPSDTGLSSETLRQQEIWTTQ